MSLRQIQKLERQKQGQEVFDAEEVEKELKVVKKPTFSAF